MVEGTGNGGEQFVAVWTGNGGGNSLWPCGQGMVEGTVCGRVDREWWREQFVAVWTGNGGGNSLWPCGQGMVKGTGNGGGNSLWPCGQGTVAADGELVVQFFLACLCS
ncbi:hypothetical protein ACOMHN_007359 [Nucella lapillus]